MATSDVFIDSCRDDTLSLGTDYCDKTWAQDLYKMVQDSNEDDYGINVVAFALLFSEVPDDKKEEAKRKLNFAKNYKKYSESLRSKKLLFQNRWLAASFVFMAIALLLVFALCYLLNNNIELYFPENFIFSSAIPLFLIFSFLSFHRSGILLPARIKKNKYTEFIKEKKHVRVFADDYRSPDYIKSAIRLAGIYQFRDGYIKTLSENALNQNQNDYGAFIAYNAYLLDYHLKNKDKDSNSQKEVYVQKNKKHVWPYYLFGLFSSVFISGIFVLAYWLILDQHYPEKLLLIVFTFCLCGFLVGLITANRVMKIYGINPRKRKIIVLWKSAWRTLWFDFVLIDVILLVLMTW